MEYGMTQGYMMGHTEFYEGVRALLVDKDKNPMWKHKNVHDITNADVQYFFTRPEQCQLDIDLA